MRDQNGFDLWADGYDEAVGVRADENAYPFAGYREILGGIYREIAPYPRASVLDIGFGTGTLSKRLYDLGCTVYGQDFSAKMLEMAAAKMPGAKLYQADFSEGLAEPLLRNKYDFIVATYSLHHLTDAQKLEFIPSLCERLKCGGRIFIGDVAFETRAELEKCRRETADWDDDEFYFVADELCRVIPGMSFRRVSFCAGIFSLSK
ncbi:MAG: class I SAM-dependent methyltransferase [Oscillospiraceae bacterium]|nr:class I SAM-dependent methyltransferase [Oscillospiraceae bacterium]